MKNITLSAPEALIEAARKRAVANGTTLNNEFRAWLQSQSVSNEQQAYRFREVIDQLGHVNAGQKFSRDDMNER